MIVKTTALRESIRRSVYDVAEEKQLTDPWDMDAPPGDSLLARRINRDAFFPCSLFIINVTKFTMVRFTIYLPDKSKQCIIFGILKF